MGARGASWTARVWGLVAAAACGCATARSDLAPGPPSPPEVELAPAGETLVILRDLAPGQPLVAFGWRSVHLPPDELARLRDGVVAVARRRGLEQVRAASLPVVVTPAPQRAKGRTEVASWGENVEAATGAQAAPPRPIPPPGVTWLEITSVILDQTQLAWGPGGAALKLEVAAALTRAPLAGGEPRAAEVRFTLLDPEPLPPLGAAPDQGGTVAAATARLVERAAGRLASLLAPAAPSAAAPEPGPQDLPAADPGPAVPLEATYVARVWFVPPATSPRSQGAVDGALKGAEAGQYLGLLGIVCGPLAPICMGSLALAGGAAGLVLGAAGGAASAPAAPPSGPMQAPLPPEPERAALLELLRRRAEGLSLAAAVERAVLRAVEAAPGADEAGAPPRLARVEVRLTGDEGPDHPARLALVLTTETPPGASGPDPLVVETPDAVPARTWADDGGALLGLVLERAAGAAGEALVARARQAAAQAAASAAESAAAPVAAPAPAPAPAAAADPEPASAAWSDER